MKKWEYVGVATNTRGDYGEAVRFGYSEVPGFSPEMICVWDSAYGWLSWMTVEAALELPDFVEVVDGG